MRAIRLWAFMLPFVMIFAAYADEPATTKPRVDLNKGRLEAGVKRVVRDTDRSLPPDSSVPIGASTQVDADRPVGSNSDRSASSGKANETVQPGLVRWHEDWATAKAAAEKSGKPIFLFQLLGRLDQRFT